MHATDYDEQLREYLHEQAGTTGFTEVGLEELVPKAPASAEVGARAERSDSD